MFYLGLAADYDGTLAQNGHVYALTLEALKALKAAGKRLILVTGRQLEELVVVFPEYRIFDRLVLENGAVLYDPSEQRMEVLCSPPNPQLVSILPSRTQEPVAFGKAIIAGWEPDQAVFLEAIRELGLELQIIFNKGALMLLPTGVNKATGLRAAARDLGLRTTALAGVGDGENDHSFLAICGSSCAVANAVDALKAGVDFVAPYDHGAGVAWFIDHLDSIGIDLPLGPARALSIGTNEHGANVRMVMQGNVLIVGPSGSGKSSLAALICETAFQHDIGLSVLDPEGDYPRLTGTKVLDMADPNIDVADYATLLQSHINPVLVLRGVAPNKRAERIREAIQATRESATRSGHPSLLVIDEAHEAILTAWDPTMPTALCVVLLTLSPALLHPDALRSVRTVVAFGNQAVDVVQEFCTRTDTACPELEQTPSLTSALIWRIGSRVEIFTPLVSKRRHIRHTGKYATGDVGPERSFYFRGKNKQYLVPAKNLFEFIDEARNLPPEVWLFHLRNGDVTRWFENVIRDRSLAEYAANLAEAPNRSAAHSLGKLAELVTERYCLPAELGTIDVVEGGEHPSDGV